MAEALGVAGAVVGLAETCLRIGKAMASKYEAYVRAETEVAESLLLLQNHWFRLEKQLQLIKSVVEDLPDVLQLHFKSLLDCLVIRLQNVITLLDKAIGEEVLCISLDSLLRKQGKVRRWVYAWTIQGNLEKAMQELTKWHDNTIEKSWILLVRVNSKALDAELHALAPSAMTGAEPGQALRLIRDSVLTASKSSVKVFLPSDTKFDVESKVQYSDCTVCKDSGGRRVVMDAVPCDPPTSDDAVIENVRNLARTLMKTTKSNEGLLSCRGVSKVESVSGKTIRFDFIFSIPHGLQHPKSLRHCLCSESRRIPFSKKFQVSRQLANSILFLHARNFVHKNIRPEIILVFSKDKSADSAFLTGFENFRPARVLHSAKIGDNYWDRNIYRHPTRQGEHPDETYKIQHDIYSLGVCLLEIGLWSTFVQRDLQDNSAKMGPGLELGRSVSSTAALKNASDVLKSVSEHCATPDRTHLATGIPGNALKDMLVAMAVELLPEKMGPIFSKVVESCLTCLDDGNEDFSEINGFRDNDGIVIGMRYMEKVTSRLEEISI